MMTLNLPPRPLRLASIVLCLGITTLAVGCGEPRERRANIARPALPIVIGVFIEDTQVRISPAETGAGAVEILVSNRSNRPRRIVLSGNGAAALTTTSISQGDTAKAQAILEPGVYTLRAGAGVQPAKLVVGPQRPSSQDELLTP